MIRRAPLPLALAVFCTAASAEAQNLKTEMIITNLQRPTHVCAPAGDTERLFITDKPGRVKIIRDGQLDGTFLDISSMVDDEGEGGLLGMAFHPDYANNGQFYLSYTTGNNNGDSIISQFTVSAGDPDVADAQSEQIIWGPLIQTSAGHKAGAIEFGPDGMLYFSIGNGYAGGIGPENRAQDLRDPRGKILRFDVDAPYPHIPPDNPFVGMPSVREEIWALGFRNPWRLGVDSLTGDVYVGDVGQSDREEISFIPAGVGGQNYGWRCKEGTLCTGQGGCDCQDQSLVDPIHEYDHSVGCSITGGQVYRGSEIPSLYGCYVFGDFCTDRFWTFKYDGNTVTEFTEITSQLQPGLDAICSFGFDGVGELYLVEHYGGEIWKVVADCGTDNYCSTAPNSAGAGAVIGNFGSTSIAADDFVIWSVQTPSSVSGLFFYGATALQGVPFGDGFRCVGGNTWRLQPPVTTTVNGSASRPVDYNVLPVGGEIDPGSTWNFQFWYRDPTGPGGTGFNLSDATTALFCP